MKIIKDIKQINKEDLIKINDSLLQFDRFLTNFTRIPTDENIGLYEHWIDCMYDIQKIIIEEKQ